MARSWTEAVEGASTLVEILERRARQQGDDLAYTFLADGEEPTSNLTYADLDRKARAIAARVRELTAGENRARALMLHPAGLDFVTAFLGCLYAGAIAVPAYPPASRRHLPRLHSIARDARPALVLSTSGTLPKLRAAAAALPELGEAAWLATDTVEEVRAGDWDGHAPAPDDLAFLQYTSGSTAEPKGVMVSHGNLMHNELVIRRQTGHSEETVFVGWLPLYHDMGLIGNVLQPVYLGIRSILMAPVAFLQKPVRWLEAISRYRGTTSGGPNFAYELCVRKVKPDERSGLDLSSWNLAFSGSEPVRADTLERFAETFGECGFRRQALYPCYGMAEATLMISGGRREAEPVVATVAPAALEQDRAVAPDGDDEAKRLVGCGHAGTDLEVVIADPSSRRRLDDDQVGEIWVAGPSVGQGYWKAPETTERDFRARLADDGGGPYLRTGDLGFLRGGELFVTGRIKDLIIIRGRNHYPQDVEAVAERSHPALRPGCGAAMSTDVNGEERLIVIHEIHRHFKGDPEVVADAVRRAVAAAHQVQVYDVVLIRTGTLPKTSSGKIRRRAGLAEYRAGTLTAVSRSTLTGAASDEVGGAELELDRAALLPRGQRRPLLEAYLRDRFARLTGSAAAHVDPDRPMTGLGLDSLAAVELKNAIESRLGVRVPLTQLLEGSTIAELTSNVLAQLDCPGAEARPALVAGDSRDAREYPLSFGQQALWYLQRLAPDNAAYNIRGAARIEAELDVDALCRAATALVGRHPVLRTHYVQEGDELRARVGAEPTFELQVHDAVGLGREELDKRLVAESHRPFDLETGPVLRFAIFVLGPREHLLLLVIHHIVADFWSLGVVVRELGVLYSGLTGDAPVELEPLALTYGDFVRWQRELIEGTEGARQWAYWQEQLAGELPLLDLPTDRPRPAVQSFAGDSRVVELDADLGAKLESLAIERDATLFMTLMAAFQVLLHRWSGQTDILVGSPTTLRAAAELEPLVGYFVNPVVIRGDLAGLRRSPFTAFVDQVRHTTLGAFAHQELPLPLLVERLTLPYDPSRSPLFQVMFAWQKDRLPEEAGLAGFALGEEGVSVELGTLEARSVKLADASSQFDLSLDMAEVGGRLMASLQYNTDLFDSATAGRILAHFATLLASITAAPETPVAELSLLSEAERRCLVEEWNPAPTAVVEVCLHHLFEAQADRTPEAVAVVGEEAILSYRALDQAANRLAHHLSSLGVGSEDRVGVLMERSCEMVVALLAILKAGGTYVPLDPSYPEQRLAFMLRDFTRDLAAPVLLVGKAALESRGDFAAEAETLGVQPLDLAAQHTAIAARSAARPEAAAGLGAAAAELVAYVIYTSGSTGRPKGVSITHRNISNQLVWLQRTLGLTPGDATLQKTPLSFDVSVEEIFWTLTAGARLVMARPEGHLDIAYLARRVADEGVTTLDTVPAQLRGFLEQPDVEQLSSLTRVFCGGETVPLDLVQQFSARFSAVELLNFYGPTETTIQATWWRCGRGVRRRHVPIGQPVGNTTAYVLDRALHPMPVGVMGELHLGGVQLARGYLNRPRSTAERFVPDTFASEPGQRLYKSGDLTRWSPGGDLEFIGRADFQVKVRGFRIELGEIEAALVRHPAVEKAVVLAHEAESKNPQIVAYVVAGGAEVDPRELLQSLSESLPAFMVPQAVMVLESLPLTPNGKIDRAELVRKADQLGRDREFVAPATEVEEMLAAIWREVLDVEEIGIHDSFFDLGGHSLKATQVLSRVREAFGIDLPVRSLLTAPTIAGLEEAIARALIEGADEETVAEILAQID